MVYRKCFVVFMSFILVLSFCCFAFADDEDDIRYSTAGAFEFNFRNLLPSFDSVSGNNNTATGELVGVEKTMLRVSPSQANGLKKVMLTLIGDYEMVTTDYTYQTSSNYYQHVVTTERDWAWICTCLLFVVVVYCTFKAVGGILCRI